MARCDPGGASKEIEQRPHRSMRDYILDVELTVRLVLRKRLDGISIVWVLVQTSIVFQWCAESTAFTPHTSTGN